jgi:hypothetical protein
VTALFDAIRSTLDRERVELVELDLDVNAPEFAHAMVDWLRSRLPSPTSPLTTSRRVPGMTRPS